jgi:hypothetical protein
MHSGHGNAHPSWMVPVPYPLAAQCLPSCCRYLLGQDSGYPPVNFDSRNLNDPVNKVLETYNPYFSIRPCESDRLFGVFSM